MKIAIVYDRVNKWGGAERVLLALQQIFPEADLFTSVYSPEKAPWAKVFKKVYTSFLQQLPFASKHELLAGLMPLAFESFCFDEYDLVISVTSEAAKGVIIRPPTKHLCICLTPTRYLWSGYDEYFSSSLLRFFAQPLVWYLRLWDKMAAARPDAFVAISTEVQSRIKKYYDRESAIVYPAITLTRQERSDKKEDVGFKIQDSRGGYFLVVSRLSKFTQYKRIDHAILAANQLKLPLVVVGDGDSSHLRSIAGPTVTFMGRVTDEELISLYQNCNALIFPAYEDFGLVMVEAQAAGKPVIAYGKGGSVDIVIDGKTGILYSEQTVASLVDTLKRFNEKAYNKLDCIKNAERFSFNSFENQIKVIVQDLVGTSH